MSARIEIDEAAMREKLPHTLESLVNKLRTDIEMLGEVRKSWVATRTEARKLATERAQLEKQRDTIVKAIAINLSLHRKNIDADNHNARDVSSIARVCQMVVGEIRSQLYGERDLTDLDIPYPKRYVRGAMALADIKTWLQAALPVDHEKELGPIEGVYKLIEHVRVALEDGDLARALASQPVRASFLAQLRENASDEKEVDAARAMQGSWDSRPNVCAGGPRVITATELSLQHEDRLERVEGLVRGVLTVLAQHPRRGRAVHVFDEAPLIDNSPKKKTPTSRRRRATKGGSKAGGKKD